MYVTMDSWVVGVIKYCDDGKVVLWNAGYNVRLDIRWVGMWINGWIGE